jgi:hypothetical protein
MGFFYAMNYTTKTTTKNGFAIVKVYQDGKYWHTYDFSLSVNYDFVQHISGKVWGTVGVLAQIQEAIKKR